MFCFGHKIWNRYRDFDIPYFKNLNQDSEDKMEANQKQDMRLLTQEELAGISGGIIFAPAVYAAFVSGAKWGAGIGLATLAVKAKFM